MSAELVRMWMEPFATPAALKKPTENIGEESQSPSRDVLSSKQEHRALDPA
jgi:hypothetical protein